MARHTFFTFHYKPDVMRASVVRQSWVTKPDRKSAGFFEDGLWESSKRESEDSLKQLIRDGIKGTSVTVVLAGEETFSRPWVRYEIVQTVVQGHGLMTVNISKIKNTDGTLADNGPKPLDYIGLENTGEGLRFVEKRGNSWYKFPGYTRLIGYSDVPGNSYPDKGLCRPLAKWYPDYYDWNYDDGYQNLGNWIEAAAKSAGK